MKINLPINNFKLVGNKVFVNDLIVEYEDISEDTREILESLISKGAYGSALLTLNMFYNVKAFNESEYSNEDYLSYLGECNKLLKECVVEIDEAHNFKPLINLNGLEIMENAENIARGKGDKMLLEDFRTGELLQEKYLKTAKYGSPVWHTYKINDNVYEFRCAYWETRGGWGHNVILSLNYDQLSEVDVRYYNRTWEMWEFQTAMLNACSKAMKTHKELEAELKQVYDQIQEGSRGESAVMQRTTISESDEGPKYAPLEKRKPHRVFVPGDRVKIKELKNPSWKTDDYVDYYNKNYLGKSGTIKSDNYVGTLHQFKVDLDEPFEGTRGYLDSGPVVTEDDIDFEDLNEEAEGTQVSDIAEKKDQEVGSLQKPKKPKKLIDKSEAIMKEMKDVPRNHGFKGFMLDESGFYARGNYVLIKEGKTIKAINRKSFEKRGYIKNK
jgi:hypothetical protein